MKASEQAHTPPFYLQAAAPAALQDVRSVPRTVCAKVKRGPRQTWRNAAAASEDAVIHTQPMQIVLGGPRWGLAACLCE